MEIYSLDFHGENSYFVKDSARDMMASFLYFWFRKHIDVLAMWCLLLCLSVPSSNMDLSGLTIGTLHYSISFENGESYIHKCCLFVFNQLLFKYGILCFIF